MNIEHETQQLFSVNRTISLNKYLVNYLLCNNIKCYCFAIMSSFYFIFFWFSFLIVLLGFLISFLFNFLREQKIKEKNDFTMHYFVLFYIKKEFCGIKGLAITRKINSLALESLTVVNCTWKVTLNYVYSLFSDLCHCR